MLVTACSEIEREDVQEKTDGSHLVSRALEVKLGLAVDAEGTPGGLVDRGSRVADTVRLPRLVKGLEVEDVDAPVTDRADRFLPVRLGLLETTVRLAVVGTICSGPTSLSVPELDRVVRAGKTLDVGVGAGHVFVVGPGGVVHLLALPEGEGVDKADGGG